MRIRARMGIRADGYVSSGPAARGPIVRRRRRPSRGGHGRFGRSWAGALDALEIVTVPVTVLLYVRLTATCLLGASTTRVVTTRTRCV